MTIRGLVNAVTRLAAELPPTHAAAWADTLRHCPRPEPAVTARLIAARPGFALGPLAAGLVEAWQTYASGLPGGAIALALETAASMHADAITRRTDVVVSGPTSDAVPVRLTSQVAVEIVRAATSSLLIVSFAAYGVAEVIAEISRAADQGVHVDVVLEVPADDGGTLLGTTPAAAAFAALRGKAAFWTWPARHRPVVAGSRAALHAKLMVADRRLTLLGSANLTNRALATNLEVGVIVRDGEVSARIARHFAALMRPGTGPLEPLT